MSSVAQLGGLIKHANINPTASANGIILQSYDPDENVTEGNWNEDASLIHDIRNALTERLTLDNCDGTEDFVANDHLRLFVNQIDTKTKEITLNASMLLEELEFYSSSPATFSFDALDDAADLDYSDQNRHANVSLASQIDWLQRIQDDALIIESWEDEAKKLSRVAIEAFKSLKSNTSTIMENATREAISVLESNADGMFLEMQTRQAEQRQLQMEKRLPLVNPVLFRDETWKAGGVQAREIIPPEIALETVKAMPLKSYKLRDDSDLGVTRDQRRTRHHVGVIDAGEGDKRVDPASIFTYNIGALSQLSTSLDRLITVSSSSFNLQSSLDDRIAKLSANTQADTQSHSNVFKSPSQLASEVAALETKAALVRVSRLSQSVFHDTRVNLINSRFVSRLKSLVDRDAMSARENRAEQDSMSARENHAEHAGAYIDQLIVQFGTVDKIKSVWNATRRELVEMSAAGATEARVAKEEIHAEASVERENEAATLEQLKLVGKARVNEIVRSVENVFWHLAGCWQHIMTPEGRQQFSFYVFTIAFLVFTISTTKELIILSCTCVLRFLSAPRLVREYGNLSARANQSTKNSSAVKEIILPPKTKERLDTLVKVVSAASERRFPLRSVLLHGKPGTGKSLQAKALAQSINLPYALMSGADVFPLGSQGPAELRRLLTWASNKHRGAIIIIDEAENALGSRGKTRPDTEKSESLGYSRDCLNVLLSMTGSFGNIMLILTTNHPSELDEAVFDRMDELIHLPLPLEKERNSLLRYEFFRLFEPKVETHPSLISRLLSKIHRAGTRARIDAQFDVDGSVSDLASRTSGLSGRELKKIVQGVAQKTYASDAGVLDSTLWEQETEKLVKTKMRKSADRKNFNDSAQAE